MSEKPELRIVKDDAPAAEPVELPVSPRTGFFP